MLTKLQTHRMLMAAAALSALLVAPGASRAEPVKAGTQFLNTGLSSSTTTVVSASSNVSGVIIRTLHLNTIGGGSCGAAASVVYAQTSAPASGLDLSSRAIATISNNGTGNTEQVAIPYPIFVPAGWGIWAANSASTTCGGLWMTYDILS